MPLLPPLSHQQFSDQSTVVQQMAGQGVSALARSQTSAIALQGCAPWK